MRHDLDPDQIRRYREQGFLVYDDLLTPAELDDLRLGVARALRRYAGVRQLDRPDESKDDGPDRIFQQRFDLWRHEPIVRRYLQGPEMGELAGRLSGVAGLRVYYDQSLVKGPWADATGFHFDNPYWSYHHRDALTVWVALDDATLQNGCLHYLPGSHRLPEQRNAGFAGAVGAIFTEHPELAGVAAVPASVRAGGCVFHNGRTAHAAGPNLTPRPRRAMTTMFIPDGAVFNGARDVLPEEEFAALTIGDPIRDDRRHPLVWRAPDAARRPRG
ncbi:MAG TPA: phytanoyl-CoA dioxygenase family protein [Planctomycetota bacterium]|nr:phytanoyl-CoA dioxygenase family protein [Planctomycetota bacterium]